MTFRLLSHNSSTLQVVEALPHLESEGPRITRLLEKMRPPVLWLDLSSLEAEGLGAGRTDAWNLAEMAVLEQQGPVRLGAPFHAATLWAQEGSARVKLLAPTWEMPRMGALARWRLDVMARSIAAADPVESLHRLTTLASSRWPRLAQALEERIVGEARILVTALHEPGTDGLVIVRPPAHRFADRVQSLLPGLSAVKAPWEAT